MIAGGLKCVPLRTHVLNPGEDLRRVIRCYTCLIARPGDMLAIAETPVAIAQGRIILPEEVSPGLLARIACRFTGKEGSLTSPNTMHVAIQMAGKTRTVLGLFLASVGKFLRVKGLFYRAVGPEVKLIDDVSGTMAPYERYIVLGPADADQVAEELKQAAGIPVMIVDANDLGKVDLVGSSSGLTPEMRRACLEVLTSNPFGNGFEQTPLVLIRPTARTSDPCSTGGFHRHPHTI